MLAPRRIAFVDQRAILVVRDCRARVRIFNPPSDVKEALANGQRRKLPGNVLGLSSPDVEKVSILSLARPYLCAFHLTSCSALSLSLSLSLSFSIYLCAHFLRNPQDLREIKEKMPADEPPDFYSNFHPHLQQFGYQYPGAGGVSTAEDMEVSRAAGGTSGRGGHAKYGHQQQMPSHMQYAQHHGMPPHHGAMQHPRAHPGQHQMHHHLYAAHGGSMQPHQAHYGMGMGYGEHHRGMGPGDVMANPGGGHGGSVGGAPVRSQAESTEVRKKIYRAELAREQLETQHKSLEMHLGVATRDLGAHQARLEGVSKLLQELCRGEAAALVAERKRNCALADLLLAMRGRRQHCLMLTQANAQVRFAIYDLSCCSRWAGALISSLFLEYVSLPP